MKTKVTHQAGIFGSSPQKGCTEAEKSHAVFLKQMLFSKVERERERVLFQEDFGRLLYAVSGKQDCPPEGPLTDFHVKSSFYPLP